MLWSRAVWTRESKGAGTENIVDHGMVGEGLDDEAPADPRRPPPPGAAPFVDAFDGDFISRSATLAGQAGSPIVTHYDTETVEQRLANWLERLRCDELERKVRATLRLGDLLAET